MKHVAPAITLVLALLAGCASPPDSVAARQAPGHDRMVALLGQIAERTPQENSYLGDRFAVELRNRLARLPEDAPADRRFGMLLDLGREEMRLGNTEQAIERLLAARMLVEQLPPPKRREAGSFVATFLGVAHLRWGETQNCIARHATDSCIMPIRGNGIHLDQEGSRKAIEHLSEAITIAGETWERFPAMWLLNIAYMTVGEYPDGVPESARIPPEAFEAAAGFPRFVDVAPDLGVDTFDLSGGAVAEDFDGDGLLDLLTSTWDTRGPLRLMLRQADGSFADRTIEAGLGGITGGLNLVQADYDNDGWTDILVLRGAWLERAGRHPNSLLRNNGDGSFTDVTFEAGLGAVHYPTQTAAWADYDHDGDLDLYVGNELQSGQPSPSQLFRNEGDGTFVDVAREAGVENLRFAKGVVWGDPDSDGLPDLYVSNLRGPNRLYRNNGDGTFTDIAPERGVERPLDSFPVWFWDFDNDGALDLYVSSYPSGSSLARLLVVAADYLGLEQAAERPRLYRGDGRGGFSDVAVELGVGRVTLPMGANFGDLDNDGFPDFYLGTGYPSYVGLVPNLMYWNRRGRQFVDVTSAGGFGHLQKGHGVVFADLDRDGDQDVFEQMGGAFPGDGFGNVLYQNPGFSNHWITVRLRGVRSNRSAIGARIRVDIVEDGQRRSVFKHVNSGGSFGCNPLTQQIGLGRANRIDALEVYWPTTGKTQRWDEVEMNQAVEITEGQQRFDMLPWEPLELR